MVKHTEGPWHLTTDAYEKHATWWILADRLRRLDSVGVVHGPIGKYEEIEANARLIQAAPDMYNELERSTTALLYISSELEELGEHSDAAMMRKQATLNRLVMDKMKGGRKC